MATQYKTPADLRLERAQALQMKRLEPQIRRAQNEQVQEALKGYKQAKIDAEIERSKKNFIVRGVSTVGDLAGNIITGALKGIEGIVDFGLAVDGALNPLAYLFDYQDATKKFSEKDLVGTYIDAPMEDFLKYSYTKDGSFGQTVEDVASGIGQLIPAAVAAYFTGGTSLAASGASIAGMTVPQAVALGVTTTSAAGNATEQAYREGAGRYKGLLYGTASGAMEAATEKLTGGIGMYGKGLLNGVVKSTAREGVEAVAKTGVKRVISNAIGEAGEEVIAELANPAFKSIYKGRDAFEEYKDADYWRGVGHAGVVGGLTSIAAEGTVGRVTKTAGAYADAQSIFEELESIEKRAAKMDMDTFARSEEKYNKSIKQNYLQLESVLKNAPSKQRANIIKKYGLSTMFTDGGSMEADFAKQLDTGTVAKYNKRYYNRAMRNNEGIIESDLERINGDLANKYDGEVQAISVFDGELSEKGRAAASKVKKLIDIASEKSGKNIGFVITDGNVQQFRGVNVGDRIYMSADTFEKGDAYEVAVEETMHFAEGSEEHNALVKLLAEDGDLEARAVDAVLGADGYGFDGEAIRDIGRRIEAGEKVSERERIAYEEYQNEVSAHMGAELLGNEKVIERIIREDSSLAEKILGKIIAFKEALGRIGDPEAQAQHKRLVEAERMYLDAIEAAGKKYVDGKIVSANDDEEKENTAEGGGKYSLAVIETNGKIHTADPSNVTRDDILHYLDMSQKGGLEVYSYFPVRAHTPQTIISTLREAGIYITDKPIAMQVAKARQSQKEGAPIKRDGVTIRPHAMKAEEIVEVIDKLGNPEAIIHQTDRTKKIKVDGEKKVVPAPDNFAVFVRLESGKECVAIIEFDSEIDPRYIIEDGKGEEYHTTVTVFEPDVTRDGLPFDYIDYLLESKPKSNRMLDIKVESPKTETAYSETDATVSEKELSSNSISQNSEKSTPKAKFSLKDDGAGIEDWMRNGMGVDSQTSANPTEADTDGKTDIDTETEGAVATKRPTSYTKEEARAMVDLMLEITSFDGTRAKFVGGDLSAVIKRAHTLLNGTEASRRAEIARKFADYVIDRAVLTDDVDPWQMQPYIETVDTLKPYLHQLDLRGLEEEIRNHYDKDTSVYARWKAPKGKAGMSLESVAEELDAKGYKLSHKTAADILFELDQDYRDAVQLLKKNADSAVREVITAAERKEIRGRMVSAILDSFDERDFSRATLTRIANQSMDEVERYRAENKRLREQSEALTKERDQAVIARTDAQEKLAKETASHQEEKAFNDASKRVLEAVQRIANWKKGVFESAAEANGDALKGVIGELSRIKHDGKISATGTRKAMKAISDWYARPDKHPIVKELQESQLYDEGVLDLMNEIGDDEKIEKNAKLSAAELGNVEIVIRHFKHIVENYHRVFRDGKYVEAKPLVEKFIKIAEENAKIQTVFGTKVMESRFYEYFGDVESIMKWNDRYNEDGFFTTTFRELREGAYRMSVAQMEMRQKLDEWLERKENKRFLDSISERTVEVRGLTMSAAEAMSLYMTTKREQAQGGILDAGFSVRDRKTGTLHSAEGLLRAAYAESGEVDLLAAQREMLNFRDELWKGFSDKERAYIQMAEKIFNGECKTRKARTDEVRLGYSNVSEDYYFPIRRGHLAQKVGEDTLGGEVQRIKSLSFNKNIVQGSKGKLYIEPINNVLDRHIAGIALYENISIPIDNFNRMFNMDVSGNKNDPRTIATVTSGDGGWADAKSYIDKLIKDIEGIRSEDKWASDTLKFIRSGFVRFQLGANPKTWATQLSSLFAATSMVDPKYMAKAMTMKANGADLDKYSPLAKLRNSENTAVIAQGVIDKVGRVGDALMVPIGKVDRYVVTRLWNACQLQVEAEQGLKLGTEENKVAAGKMLEKVIFETQQNSLLTERSAAMRSSNELIKGLTMFSADGMKITGRVLDAFGRISVIKERLKNAEGATKTKLEAELKGATKEFRRSSAAMVSTAVFMSVIAYAFSHLYGKRDEDETTGEAIATFLGDFVGNLLGGLPLIRDIYSYIVDGYELNNYALSSVNDLLSGASGLISLAGDIINGREVTSQQIATKTKAALFGVGQLFGIPLRNAYNVGRGVIGLSGLIIGNGNSIGYAWDSLFYDKSYRSDLNKAMEKGDEKMVAMIADLMVNESLGTIDAKSREAIKSLIGEGYDVLPRSVGDSVTYDGEEYEFTARSRKRFEEVYGIADEAVKDLVSMSKFSSADAAVQAKAIRFIYDVYYNLALEDFLGVDIENKTVLFAQALDIEKLALIVATARSIEGDKDRNGKTINGSKKLKVVKYIESLRMTAAEKYMIMGYLGYKNVNGEAAVRSYINKLSLTKQEKTKLLSYSGYAA